MGPCKLLPRASASGRAPCVVFDLDGCLWHPEMYQLKWRRGGGPFEPQSDGSMKDRRGNSVALCSGVPAMMWELSEDPRWNGVPVAVASCCDAPSWARELLAKFKTRDGDRSRALSDIVTVCQIHGGSKVRHFEEIASATGCSFQDMLFFDNEPGNCTDVAALGVTSVFCPGGITERVWQDALRAFPAPRGALVRCD
ncbi:unnamed protein product [Prorocentrum cordatum]|uniref:Magnesium-dependent phosphatase 1 n=1 Tax=Prorocentrum cordatum TaxID=2364126 RepID=A0ABN9Y1Q9_9DINO|nr:unnamed protein product [Polarella glacialis]